MKRLISVILTIVLIASIALTVASCAKKTDGEINVVTLNGTTGFGMANLMKKAADGKALNDYNFKVETDASVVMAGLTNGTIDIAALPTNAAANLYNKTNGGIQIIAVNTLGVLYILTNGNAINSIDDLAGKTVYCPAQNPAFILNYIIEQNSTEENNLKEKITVDSTTYSTPDALRAAVIANDVEIAVLPEPMVTIVKNQNPQVAVALDITAEWNKVSGGKQLVQGCVVVRTEFAEKFPGTVNSFLREYKKSISSLNEDPETAAANIKEFGIFAKEEIAKAAIPNCNIKYLGGNDMKIAMSNFLEAMYSVAPQSIGNKLPGESFYYVG